MKILIVSGPDVSLREPYNSGIEAFIISFANELIRQGHWVEVVAGEAESNAQFVRLDLFSKSSLTVPEMHDEDLEKFQFKKLDLESYDVIHFNMFYPHLIDAVSQVNTKVFLTLHSPVDNERSKFYKHFSEARNVIFIAVSERMKYQWGESLQTDIQNINNGINLSVWPIGNSEARNYLLWSARINKVKNVSAAIALARYMNIPLKIAGRIADQKYFDQEVKPYLDKDIIYLGHITQGELSRLAHGALAYLATALWQEPFGLSSLEMLASGVPVVGFSTAIPSEWEHESVLKTSSDRWQDLEELIIKSKTVSSYACRAFASQMNATEMTSQYIQLFKTQTTFKSMNQDLSGVNTGTLPSVLSA